MEKLRQLLRKDLLAKDKTIICVTIGFALSFNFLFFGTLHIFISNFSQFMMPFSNVLTAATIVFLLVWIAVSGILLALPGRISTIASSLALGVLVAGYLQGNFFNSLVDLGELTGDAIAWHEHTMYTLLNTALWFFIIFIPAVVFYFAPVKVWKKTVLIACALLTGMQAAALATFYVSNSDDLVYVPDRYLSREGAYEVSSEKNILVFVIDRLDYTYIEQIRESDPHFFDRLDGFTDFTDAVSGMGSTFPSAMFMTTGIQYDYLQTRADYFDYAWNNSEFVRMLKEAGYTTKYHMPPGGYMYTDYEQILYAADNLKDGRLEPKLRSVIKNFTILSAYRFAPMALKPTFWLPMVVIETDGKIQERDYVSNNDYLFMELLNEKGLSLQESGNNYFYLHLYGAHGRFNMNENGELVGAGNSNLVSHVKGCFSILYRYMDEMKTLGVYDDSTIIILGDHGWDTWNIGFFVKPSGSANTPLVQNNAPIAVTNNMLATILKSEGMDGSSFGISAFDVEEDAQVERYFVSYIDESAVAFYKVTGDLGDENNWEMIDSREFYMDFHLGLPIE